MTKPADMTRDELLAEVDRLATLNNELSQILNRNADTLQASAQQIQRDAVRQAAVIVREGGGVMPEDLPEVRILEDAYLVRPDDSSLPVTMISADNVTPGDIARWRAKARAYLAIAQKIEGDTL